MFANRLKELRKSQPGLTQESIAKQIGVAKTTYASYEQGKRQPDYEVLSKIAKRFDVTIDYLLGNNETPKWANEKDTNDLQKFLTENEGSMTYGGENLTKEEKEKLKIAMTQIFWSRHKHN
ncbi:helix-turn-helix domain-containing protein [Secundilactobacillus kimchicus]|uniref:helix-turn-helix domain-containing protein n=1 Tax=Secundilactobacillus kimchicus TaxID=528209 RepID=UPI001C018C5B|nr:helix-turn-helix transcriptional regulator [Secundilactobacillus kimchicus]MBT9670890.1 helix-turn-helix domain-containing protein [Secundilactobacillus kimchicus]